ncbi:diguanylate cyclase/phosphodiesterase (GGDEF & EAL domains) with PAS/PAC sensor(s) [hydrothermal vent metagenome]|uniref:Diguanylate cyclase/phosphodiesterase (GGDEF & EAL domains) with PAS/PAC sensor(S) n=1 Tax=hydrothermal vent metagenome TaxID=652676 RepID=A0A3B0XXB9_9ZZZZ
MNKQLHHIADASLEPSPVGDRSVLSDLTARKALEITQALQTSLDLTRLIEIFSMEAGTLTVHQGLRYRNDDLDLEVKLGREARHSCTYTLNIGDEPLGKLTFRRNQRFTEPETEAIEHLLCSLLYPLRNALLYQDALQLAQKDPLTGISNRSALDEMMQRELSHARRQGSSCAMIILDIDHFKKINDKYGHITGDCALKNVASMMDSCKRDGDLLFRYGGEEFVILMRDTDEDGALLLAERIRHHIENTTCHCSGAELAMTVSIGISVLQDDDSPISLFTRADQALYNAKHNGRNQVCMAEEPEPRIKHLRSL